MIVKGDTYPTAMLMVFELDGDFDAREAVTHGNVDAEMSENFTELNSSATDFGGFPSSMIEAATTSTAPGCTPTTASSSPPAPPQKPGAGGQRYLIQFTVTGYADKAAEESTDMETIISGFTVEVPK